ncbi:uncharacterized protein K444DRAFT_270339 [Hyaloscypha bicolor E]|uniref:Uncharacterized protein n=1 Tax=Hyaloscypha bicolor E TaxID=1095630 RepID=A0A2J6SIC1_9HELO|nr:uncharacterized protein K444DRAFT_270339 [Hyaloscypha bicolor E]PMD50507.1 hypothetical protein K444DRAFT_270339 [Hyaloscypha bicolor E]
MRLRERITTPARLSQGVDPGRPRRNILGTPQPPPIVPATAEQSQPTVPELVGQSKARGGCQVLAVPQLLKDIPAATPSISQPDLGQWTSLTDTMKLVIWSVIQEATQASDLELTYQLDFSDQASVDMYHLLRLEFERQGQFDADADEIAQTILAIAKISVSGEMTAEQRSKLDLVEQQSKRNLPSKAPEDHMVQPDDVAAAENYVRTRFADSPLRKQIIESINRHRGKEYGRAIIGAILPPIDDDEDEDGDKDAANN